LTYLDQTKSAKIILQPERRRREGQCLPDVWRLIIPRFGIFSFFLAFLNSFVFCVVSTVLRVRCYLHLRWYYFIKVKVKLKMYAGVSEICLSLQLSVKLKGCMLCSQEDKFRNPD